MFSDIVSKLMAHQVEPSSSGFLDRFARRNREMNEPIVGVAAATYSARCVVWGLLLSVIAAIWALVYVVAVFKHADSVAGASLLLLLLVGSPMAWLSVRNSSRGANLAAEYMESRLGFRPRWWMCYANPRGWQQAIARQKRWQARGRWPLIPW
jgi:hypothetical protein